MTDLMSDFESFLEEFPILCTISGDIQSNQSIFYWFPEENGNIGCRKGIRLLTNMAPQEALSQVI